jgi:hypothetical protein
MEDNLIRMQYATACRNIDLSHVSFKADMLSISNTYPQWTSKGKIGTYIWRSLTTLYVPGFISIDQNKKLYNDHHLRCTHKGGNGMASLILESIHQDMELESILQNQRIVNTDIMYADGEDTGGEFLHGLNMFLRDYTEYRDEPDVLLLTGPMHLDFTDIKGQDLIFTFPLLDLNSLNQFVSLAYSSIQLGANTAMALFVTRLMQNANGEFPSGIPADYGFPESPRGYSFSELVDML